MPPLHAAFLVFLLVRLSIVPSYYNAVGSSLLKTNNDDDDEYSSSLWNIHLFVNQTEIIDDCTVLCVSDHRSGENNASLKKVPSLQQSSSVQLLRESNAEKCALDCALRKNFSFAAFSPGRKEDAYFSDNDNKTVSLKLIFTDCEALTTKNSSNRNEGSWKHFVLFLILHGKRDIISNTHSLYCFSNNPPPRRPIGSVPYLQINDHLGNVLLPNTTFNFPLAIASLSLILHPKNQPAGPVNHPDDWFPPNSPIRDCLKTAARNLHLLGEFATLEEAIVSSMSENCLLALSYEGEEEDELVVHSKSLAQRLVEAAVERDLLDKNVLVKDIDAIFDSSQVANDWKRAWLSVSWVPLEFEERHIEVLLLELLTRSATNDRVEKTVRTLGGDSFTFDDVKFLALVGCEEDLVAAIAQCIGNELGVHLFDARLEGVVWGLGFADRRVEYPLLWRDLNAHARYKGRGRIPKGESSKLVVREGKSKEEL